MERAFGDYVLLERIGAGGMGEVFRARKTGPEGFSKEVAVKLILPHLSREEPFRSLFSREARLAAGLKHPNIVDVHGFAIVGQTAVIEMELVHGADLRRLIRSLPEGGRLPLPETALILHRVARGLSHAHSSRGGAPAIVHRDLSPQNILISREGEVKVADFGIARAAEEGTSAGGPKGKAMYMSPEQARGEELTTASDLFTLGTIARQILTGRHPFDRGNEAASLSAIAAARHDPIPPDMEVPSVLSALTDRMLRMDPRERPSAQDAVHVLDPFVSAQAERDLGERVRSIGRGEVLMDPAAATAATVRPRKSPWPMVAAGVFAAALAFWAIVGPLPRRAAAPPGRTAPTSPPATIPENAKRAGSSPAASDVEPAAPPVRQTTVTVVTDPPGAWISEAGSTLGQAPIEFRHEPSGGVRRLTALLEGYQEAQFELDGASGAPVVKIALSPIQTGSVRIAAIPWASVSYDGRTLGETPRVVEGLPAGRRMLVLENVALGVRRDVVVDVRPGETVTLNVDLRAPLP